MFRLSKISSRLLRLTGFTILTLAIFACRLASQAIAPSTNPTNGISPTTITTSPLATIPSNAMQLQLKLVGDMRPLPIKIFGANCNPFVESNMDNPSLVQAISETAPSVLRFPGGSLANYYDWHDGQLHLNPQPKSSSYYKFWVSLAAMIARAHPSGVHYEPYVSFAQQVGNADILIVPNLETSSISE